MRKLVALMSGLVLGFTSAQAIVRDAVVPTPVLQAQSDEANVYNVAFHSVDLNKLTRAERMILGRTYEHQDVDIRLNRLERSVFNRLHPGLTYGQRIDNILANADYNSTSGIASNKLAQIEQKVFNRTFAMDTARSRIERLEHGMFGAVQNGDLNARYETLNRAAKTMAVRQATEAQRQSGWKGALGNILMGGMVTGMTPPIRMGMDPYSTDFLDDRGAGGGTNYYTGDRGWAGSYSGYNNNSVGTRSGITILD